MSASQPSYTPSNSRLSPSITAAASRIDMHLPRPLQSSWHTRRWHASPVKPDRHSQRPVSRSHIPMLEHSVSAACAVLLPVAWSTHAFPLGQSPLHDGRQAGRQERVQLALISDDRLAGRQSIRRCLMNVQGDNVEQRGAAGHG